MRRFFPVFLLCCLAVLQTVAQSGPVMPRANVVAYDDEDAIARLDYRSSPYYRELAGSWKQHSTDSSLTYTRQLDVAKTWRG
jgi:hypothetical protein